MYLYFAMAVHGLIDPSSVEAPCIHARLNHPYSKLYIQDDTIPGHYRKSRMMIVRHRPSRYAWQLPLRN